MTEQQIEAAARALCALIRVAMESTSDGGDATDRQHRLRGN